MCLSVGMAMPFGLIQNFVLNFSTMTGQVTTAFAADSCAPSRMKLIEFADSRSTVLIEMYRLPLKLNIRTR